MGTGQQAVVVAGRRCGRLCHHRMPLPPPRVAPLLPAAAAISALACISVQPRVLVPGQREGMEASLWPMSRPVPQLQSFRVISAMTRSPVSSSRACSSGTPSAFCTHTALATSHTSASLSQARTERQNGAGPWPLAAKPPPGLGLLRRSRRLAVHLVIPYDASLAQHDGLFGERDRHMMWPSCGDQRLGAARRSRKGGVRRSWRSSAGRPTPGGAHRTPPSGRTPPAGCSRTLPRAP